MQTERFREQIRREERTLEAWTLKYLSDPDRAKFVDDASNHRGQYPPKQIWTGGAVQQPLDPTEQELEEEERLAQEALKRGYIPSRESIALKAAADEDVDKPLPEGYRWAALVPPCPARRAPSLPHAPLLLLSPADRAIG